jgi:hypothetical protein
MEEEKKLYAQWVFRLNRTERKPARFVLTMSSIQEGDTTRSSDLGGRAEADHASIS